MIVHKFPLPNDPKFSLELPKEALILSVQLQRDTGICLWALVNENNSIETRNFQWVMTGELLDNTFKGKFLGTVQVTSAFLVFHLFEV